VVSGGLGENRKPPAPWPAIIAFGVIISLSPVFGNGYNFTVLAYFQFLIGLAFLLYLARTWPEKELMVRGGRLILPLLAFVFISGLSISWSIEPNESIREFWKLLAYLLLFFLTLQVLQPKHAGLLTLVVVYTGAVLAVYGLGLFVFVNAEARVQGTFVNSNAFGIYLAMAGLVAVGHLIESPRRAPVWGAAVAIFVGLILTLSRGAMLAAAAGFLLVLCGAGRGRRIRTAGLLAALVIVTAISAKLVVVGAGAVQQNPDIVRRINRSSLFDRGMSNMSLRLDEARGNIPVLESNGESSLSGRLSFWKVAWRMIKERPLTGVGLGNFHTAYFFYRDDQFYSKYTHNHYLQTWAETGIVGLVLFLVFLVGFWVDAWANRSSVTLPGIYLGIVAAVSAFLLHAAVDFSWNMPAVTLLFWFLLGTSAVMRPPANAPVMDVCRHSAVIRGVAAILVVVFVVGVGSGYLAEKLFTQGLSVSRGSDRERAYPLFRAASRLNPLDPVYHSHLSRELERQAKARDNTGLMQAALVEARKAEQLSPWEGFFHNQVGRFYWQLDQHKMAEAELKKAAVYGKYILRYHVDLGNYFLYRGELDRAETAFRNGLAVEADAQYNVPTPQKVEQVRDEVNSLRFGLARVYFRRGDKADVEEQLRRILADDPGDAIARRLMDEYKAGAFDSEWGTGIDGRR